MFTITNELNFFIVRPNISLMLGFFVAHVDECRRCEKKNTEILDEMCLDWRDICYSFNKCCILNVNPITSMDRWKNCDFKRCCINVVSTRVTSTTQISFNWLGNPFEWALLWFVCFSFSPKLLSLSLLFLSHYSMSIIE